jgi:hypothetical protein
LKRVDDGLLRAIDISKSRFSGSSIQRNNRSTSSFMVLVEIVDVEVKFEPSNSRVEKLDIMCDANHSRARINSFSLSLYSFL